MLFFDSFIAANAARGAAFCRYAYERRFRNVIT